MLRKTPYEKPESAVVVTQPLSYVLMASNQGYPVDTFNPSFGTSSNPFDMFNVNDPFESFPKLP